jgi:purine-binding chemotaxis protein CheW
VVNIATDDIEDTPRFGEGAASPYLLGMAKIKGKVKILLDVDEMLSGQEFPGLESALLGRNA